MPSIPARILLALSASLALSSPACAQPADALLVGGLPLAAGPFDGTLDALNRYRTPSWFRDAKLGIWSHWGPQSVPGLGDWYARRMYEENSDAYKHHVQTYGHPSKFGFKDIIPLWKGEAFDADRLAALYARAGAKYLVAAAVHFDNFDLWNSKFHPWNSVAMGAKRDVVGEWKAATRKNGLRFGVSEHLAASFGWFQASHGADAGGSLAGVPYDGADPKLQSFYHRRAAEGDGWLSNDAEFHLEWQRRVRDLLDQHAPDLLFSDSPLPFGTIGSGLVSHFYNANRLANGGEVRAVYIPKQFGGSRWVQQIDGGPGDLIPAEPWQNAMTISDWYYRRGMSYKSTGEVIHTLCDTVSKNGNLLLNVPHRPDGSLDTEAEAFLAEMADWTKLNGEAIFGTRPWSVFGERAQVFPAGDGAVKTQEVRYTRRGDDLYAIMLGWPGPRLPLRALALGTPLALGQRPTATFLGDDNPLLWSRTRAGLAIELGDQARGKHAIALKISGLKMPDNVAPLEVEQWQKRLLSPGKEVWPDAEGSLLLAPDLAELHGALRVQDEGERRNIGYWDDPAHFVTWDRLQVTQPGTYRVTASISTVHAGAEFVLEVAGRELPVQVLAGKDWYDFKPIDAGVIEIKGAGEIALKMRTVSREKWRPIDIQWIRLEPVPQELP